MVSKIFVDFCSSILRRHVCIESSDTPNTLNVRTYFHSGLVNVQAWRSPNHLSEEGSRSQGTRDVTPHVYRNLLFNTKATYVQIFNRDTISREIPAAIAVSCCAACFFFGAVLSH